LFNRLKFWRNRKDNSKDCTGIICKVWSECHNPELCQSSCHDDDIHRLHGHTETDIDPRFAETKFVVEATGCEQLNLWSQYSHHGSLDHIPPFDPTRRYEWVQDNLGASVEVGKFNGEPVRITVFWMIIEDMRVAFWNPCSNVIDRRMIDRWLMQHCAPTWGGGRLAHTNAMNFHHVLHTVDEWKKKNEQQ